MLSLTKDKRVHFDKDLNSKHAELFLKIRQKLMTLIGPSCYEKQSENITSYFSKYGGICYLKTIDKGVHIGWFKGAYIDDVHQCLFGKGKVIRAHIVSKLGKSELKAITNYVDQTVWYLHKHHEEKLIRKT